MLEILTGLYGRQANKTFPELEIELPIDSSGNPDWNYMENYIKSLHCTPLTTRNDPCNVPKLNTSEWKEFKLSDYFHAPDAKFVTNFKSVL